MNAEITISFQTDSEYVVQDLYKIINSIAPYMVDNVSARATIDK